jgi:hypothetical protein
MNLLPKKEAADGGKGATGRDLAKVQPVSSNTALEYLAHQAKSRVRPLVASSLEKGSLNNLHVAG